jgi:hypothetical protein
MILIHRLPSCIEPLSLQHARSLFNCLLLIFTNLLGPVTWLLFSTPRGRMIERLRFIDLIVHPSDTRVRACFHLVQKAGSLVEYISSSTAVRS